MNIFKEPDQSRRVMTVVKLSRIGFYVVIDSSGRKSVAGSSETWRKGESVAVLGNQIIGKAGRAVTGAVAQV